MDLLARGTCMPAATARGAIVEKGLKRCKAIGDYLNSHTFCHTRKHCGSELARDEGLTFDIYAECFTTIASRLAPTFMTA